MDTSTQLMQIPLRIVREQELVIGPLAWSEASKVNGLKVDPAHKSVSLSGDAGETIDRLVGQYEKIFGKASHAVCRDAVRDIVAQIPPGDIPASLK